MILLYLFEVIVVDIAAVDAVQGIRWSGEKDQDIAVSSTLNQKSIF